MDAGERQRRGLWGEAVAEAYLKRKGLRVLERRWRSGRGELDLVLRAGRVLVVVEVRTRSGAGDLRGPYFSISRRKWQVLRQTVSRYVQASAWRPHAARLDVVGVQGTPDGPEPVVTHWSNVGALGAQWRF